MFKTLLFSLPLFEFGHLNLFRISDFVLRIYEATFKIPTLAG